jgi:integrase-like protein
VGLGPSHQYRFVNTQTTAGHWQKRSFSARVLPRFLTFSACRGNVRAKILSSSLYTRFLWSFLAASTGAQVNVLKALFVGVIPFEPALDLLNRGIEFRRDSFQIGAFGMSPACELPAIVGNDARFWRLLDPTKRLRRVTFHSLRHSCASAMIATGAAITEVQNQLGHSNPSITLGIYSHWFKNAKGCGAVERLAKMALGTLNSETPPEWAVSGHSNGQDVRDAAATA